MAAAYKPKFSPDKFKELLLYAANKSVTDEYFGAVKLSKILFFSDFLAYGLLGDSITGATYVRKPNGPVPRELRRMVGELEKEKYAILMTKPIFNYMQKRLVAYREANVNVFSPEEVDLIDNVITHLTPKNASEVSDFSHERSFAWEIAEEGEEIPYTAVFLSRREPTKSDVERGIELASQYGWLNAGT